MKPRPLDFIAAAWPHLHPYQRAALLARFISFQIINRLPKERRKVRVHLVGKDRRKPAFNPAPWAWLVALGVLATIIWYPNPRAGVILAAKYGLMMAFYLFWRMAGMLKRSLA